MSVKHKKLIESFCFFAITALLFFVSPVFAQQNSCSHYDSNSNLIIDTGCIVDLGDNPVTRGNITNNGTLKVGKGVWRILGTYIQNSQATLISQADSIDLSAGEMIIHDADLSASGGSDQAIVTIENGVSNKCSTLTLRNSIVKNSNTELIIKSNCTPEILESDNNNLLAPLLTSIAVLFTLFPLIQNLSFIASSPIDLWYLILRWFENLLQFFGFKRKRKYWGTVYDSVSKQPLDPVMVRLIDAQTGKVVESAISDLYGHFGFLVRTGEFILTAEKNGYAYPSKISTQEHDEIFDHLYHGEVIKITDTSQVITPNIPMDQLRYDFNQEAKKKIIHFHPWLNWSVYMIMSVLFWIGFLVSVVDFIRVQSTFHLFLLAVYVALVLYKVFWPHHRIWGRLTNKRGQALPDMVLELNYAKLAGVIVGRAKTAADGKFFLKANPGEYKLIIKPMKSNEPLLVTNVTINKTGVLNSNLIV